MASFSALINDSSYTRISYPIPPGQNAFDAGGIKSAQNNAVTLALMNNVVAGISARLKIDNYSGQVGSYEERETLNRMRALRDTIMSVSVVPVVLANYSAERPELLAKMIRDYVEFAAWFRTVVKPLPLVITETVDGIRQISVPVDKLTGTFYRQIVSGDEKLHSTGNLSIRVDTDDVIQVTVMADTRYADAVGNWHVLKAGFYFEDLSKLDAGKAWALHYWKVIPAALSSAMGILVGFNMQAPVYATAQQTVGTVTLTSRDYMRVNAFNDQAKNFNKIAIAYCASMGIECPVIYKFKPEPVTEQSTFSKVVQVGIAVAISMFVSTAVGTVMKSIGLASGTTTATTSITQSIKAAVTDPVAFFKGQISKMLAKPVELVTSVLSDPIGTAQEFVMQRIEKEIIKVTGPLGKVYEIYVDPAGFVRNKIDEEILYPLQNPGDWIVDTAKKQIRNRLTGELRDLITGAVLDALAPDMPVGSKPVAVITEPVPEVIDGTPAKPFPWRLVLLGASLLWGVA